MATPKNSTTPAQKNFFSALFVDADPTHLPLKNVNNIQTNTMTKKKKPTVLLTISMRHSADNFNACMRTRMPARSLDPRRRFVHQPPPPKQSNTQRKKQERQAEANAFPELVSPVIPSVANNWSNGIQPIVDAVPLPSPFNKKLHSSAPKIPTEIVFEEIVTTLREVSKSELAILMDLFRGNYTCGTEEASSFIEELESLGDFCCIKSARGGQTIFVPHPHVQFIHHNKVIRHLDIIPVEHHPYVDKPHTRTGRPKQPKHRRHLTPLLDDIPEDDGTCIGDWLISVRGAKPPRTPLD
jgi:hypothetical protein